MCALCRVGLKTDCFSPLCTLFLGPPCTFAATIVHCLLLFSGERFLLLPYVVKGMDMSFSGILSRMDELIGGATFARQPSVRIFTSLLISDCPWWLESWSSDHFSFLNFSLPENFVWKLSSKNGKFGAELPLFGDYLGAELKFWAAIFWLLWQKFAAVLFVGILKLFPTTTADGQWS